MQTDPSNLYLLLPFHFNLTVRIELDIESLPKMLPQYRNDLHRLLQYAFIESPSFAKSVSDVEEHSGQSYTETDIAWFYASLKRPSLPVYSQNASYLADRKGKGRDINPNSRESPAKSHLIIEPPHLIPKLMPFQSRSLEWMLFREGKRIAGRDENKKHIIKDIALEDGAKEARRGSLWERIHFDDGGDLWLNSITLDISEEDPAEDGQSLIEGSIAAEEMGLGKTVEMLALILLHTARERQNVAAYFAEISGSVVQPSGQTLLVCPQAIVSQWQDEIERHAPTLRVLRYEGIHETFPRGFELEQIINDYDLVICTFDVLGRETAIARKPVVHTTRSNSHKPEYARINYKRSLLVSIDWLRVIIDEARMFSFSVLQMPKG